MLATHSPELVPIGIFFDVASAAKFTLVRLDKLTGRQIAELTQGACSDPAVRLCVINVSSEVAICRVQVEFCRDRSQMELEIGRAAERAWREGRSNGQLH